MNDGTSKDPCSLNYITIDDAVNHILELGCATHDHLAKINIKNPFRLIPLHSTDRHLLGMQWKDGIYIDTCLPFGLRSAPKLFNILAEFMAGIMKQQGISPLLHYFNDFLILTLTLFSYLLASSLYHHSYIIRTMEYHMRTLVTT